MTVTTIIILITVAISIYLFRKPSLFARFQLSPFFVVHRHEWFRLITHGFIHADWVHLSVNMIVLYSFGTVVENLFNDLAYDGLIRYPKLLFLIMYLSSIVISSLVTVFKEKDNISYSSVGASGAISTVVFSAIFFFPVQKIYFYAVIPMPGIIFGVLYLLYSQYMSIKNKDNINHDAHFVGAIYGLAFPLFMDPGLFDHFINQIRLGLNL